ncbi:hypothetical protein BM86_25615 [Bacillus thuringiensis]|nr:hypothetical protein [Bacillus thuringiensis]
MIFSLSLHVQCASINYKNMKEVNKSRYPSKKLPSNREVTFSIVSIFEILFTYMTVLLLWYTIAPYKKAHQRKKHSS